MVVLDLRKAFHHVPIQIQDRDLCGFRFDGLYYRWRTLPFGWNCSPYFHTKVLKQVSTIFALPEYASFATLTKLLSLVSETLYPVIRLSLLSPSWDGTLTGISALPATFAYFIGYNIYTVSPTHPAPFIEILTEHVRKLRKDIRRLLTVTSGQVTARRLARVCGQCVAMSRAILPGKLLLRNCYRLLAKRNTWDSTLDLDQETRSDLQWWFEALGPDEWNGSVISTRPIQAQLETDASDSGWGGFLDGKHAAGSWTRRMATKSINYRELVAVLLSLNSFASSLRGKHVQILSDNISCVAYINHLDGPSKDLSELAQSLWITAAELGITLTARYLAGGDNWRADTLSWLSPIYEWRLHPGLFSMLDRIHGPFTIDHFAAMTNTQLPRYNSLTWDPQTSGVDALAQSDWNQHNNYVNPPFLLLPRVLRLMKHHEASGTVIAPWWPSQPWLNQLQAMLTSPSPQFACRNPQSTVAQSAASHVNLPLPPVRLPKSARTILCQGTCAEPLNNPRWRLYAWRISGVTD